MKRKRALQLQEANQSEPGATVDHAHQAAAQGQAQSAEDPALPRQLEDTILQILQTRKAGATC